MDHRTHFASVFYFLERFISVLLYSDTEHLIPEKAVNMIDG